MRKWAVRILAGVMALVILAGVAGLLVLRSAWFRQKVRERAIATIEEATGGRVEAGAFRFDWKRMRAEVDGLVLHGTEPSGKPPLFRAATVAVGLKIISLRRRDIDIRYLEVESPQVYLIVDSSGRTNVPEPKIKGPSRSPVEGLIDLAIGRFKVENGVFEVESRGKTPFAAAGRNLALNLDYEPAGPRYRGNLAIQPLEMMWNRQKTGVQVEMGVVLERNRVTVNDAHLATGASKVQFSGTIEDLVSPRYQARYQATVSLPEMSRLLEFHGPEQGTLEASGEAVFTSLRDYNVSGEWRALGVALRQGLVAVRSLRASGRFRVDSKGEQLAGVQLVADTSYSGRALPVAGQISAVTVRGQQVELAGMSLNLLDGSFHGDASLRGGSHVNLRGEISGLEARRVVALYNPAEPLPWDSRISGPVTLEGSLPSMNDARVSAKLVLGVIPGTPAVWGQLEATYDSRDGSLDLGSTILNLPSSRVVVSGSLGRQIRAHLDTRDLNDFLPALGTNARSLPVRLENGSLVFDGSVAGKLESPLIAGRLAVNRFSYSGDVFDSFEGTIALSAGNLRVQNGALARGPLRTQFEGSMGLQNWKPGDGSSVAASGTVRNASVAVLLSDFGRPDVPVTGTLNASAKISGTIGDPRGTADLNITKGTLRAEPFDRLSAQVSYTGRELAVSSGLLTAGPKRAQFEANLMPAGRSLDTGRLHFQLKTNDMALDQIETVKSVQPGVRGLLQMSAAGELDLAGGSPRLKGLNADASAKGIQVDGKALGSAHLTANTDGALLRARVESDIACSVFQGQGEWRLEGDYPGNATINFAGLDFTELRRLAASSSVGPASIRGSADGAIRVDGPALKPEQLKGEVRIDKLELAPGPSVSSPVKFTLRNSGPVLASVNNSAVNITSARFMGTATDFSVGGRFLFDRKNPLDLRANGNVDFGILQELDSDVMSSGAAAFEVSLRGSLQTPQITGRLEFDDAAFSYATFPNGISKAKGVVGFSGNRATIQSFSGETGGGRIRLTGFAGYSGDQGFFRLHADASGVRLRYPEGLSTVSNADLNFAGTSDRSTLSGTVSVLRSAINVQTDFSSLLAKSAQPAAMTPAGTGFLAGLNFDVQVQTVPGVQIESALTEGVEADANLRLRGTGSNPALQGRINVSQGRVNFFGSKYDIAEGSITFTNPLRIDPVFDVDLETRMRGIDVTITIAGPLNKLTITPRSDPPLQLNEIVSLLATGQNPTTDPTNRLQQTAVPQPAQQTAAAAVLGQVITSPVSGRLQRFFGLSGIRIDPTLPGIAYSPQARVTLQQQVTPDITFTYISNVTQANPQVISVEWAVNKQWSVTAEREENGVFGMDFFYKRRFK
jgi:translocation and assembly module TamB